MIITITTMMTMIKTKTLMTMRIIAITMTMIMNLLITLIKTMIIITVMSDRQTDSLFSKISTGLQKNIIKTT